MTLSKHIIWINMDFHPVYTGHGIYLQKLAPYLVRSGYSFTLLTPQQNADDPEEEGIGDIFVKRIKCLDKNGLNFLKFCLRSVAYLWKKRKSFQIIHIHGFFDRFGVFAFFSKCMQKKLIMQMVLLGVDDPFSCIEMYKYKGIRRFFFQLMDSFVTISTPLTKACMDFGLKKEKVIQIPQGVNTKIFEPVKNKDAQKKLREKLGLPTDKKIAIFVGAIIYRKGVRELLSVWKEIQEKRNDIFLILLGPYVFSSPALNDFVKEMKKFVSDSSLHIDFKGSVENVQDYMCASDLFVFPSQKEGFGNVIIEAMACGLPCIVTEMDGVGYDTVLNGETGFIVKNNPELKEKIEILLDNEKMGRQFGLNGKIRAAAIFEFSAIALKYVDVYKGLIENN
jgi:glycosyltransferase involved in cell wall biosynthesis